MRGAAGPPLFLFLRRRRLAAAGVGKEELEAKELAPHIPLNSVGSLRWTFLLNNNVINTASIHEPCHSPQMFYKPAK